VTPFTTTYTVELSAKLVVQWSLVVAVVTTVPLPVYGAAFMVNVLLILESAVPAPVLSRLSPATAENVSPSIVNALTPSV
jgi:hypothetical protein